MTKILHVCSRKGFGGTQTVFAAHQKLFDLLNIYSTAITRKNIKFILTTRSNRDYLTYFRRIPIQVQPDYKRLRRLSDNFDVIWVHKPIDCFIWRKIAPSKKIVLVVHGFQNTHLKLADYLVAVSVPVQQHLLDKGFTNVFLINNFLDKDIRTSNIKWNDKIQISSFGFFRRKKGFTDLVDALSILENKLGYKNFQCSIFGKGRMFPFIKLKSLFKKTSKLNIKPWTHNISEVLKSTDIVVIPSRSESFSMVAVEAMAAGCLVISTKCKGPEYIVNHEKDGILVEKRNSHAMAEAIKNVIDNPEKFSSLRMLAPETIRMKFSTEQAKKCMFDFLQVISKDV